MRLYTCVFFIVFCVFLLFFQTANGIPVLYKTIQLVPIMRSDEITQLGVKQLPGTERLTIGDIIQNSGIFPIQINVPDTLSAIYQGVSNVATGIAQQFPILRPYVRPETPRPYKYLVIAPGKGIMVDKGIYVVPFFKQKVTVVDIPETGGKIQEFGKDIVLKDISV